MKSLIFIVLLFALNANAQSFRIVNAGELKLGTNEITSAGKVTQYFGMNVEGSGESIIRVRVGDVSYSRSYTFQLYSTRLFSYFFKNNLAELGDKFIRGIKGTISIDILSSEEGGSTSTDMELDVLLPKKNCRGKPKEACKQAQITKLTKRQLNKFLKEFSNAIKGPIVLEP